MKYIAGRKLYDRRVGLFAALFLSVSVLHVTYSHIAVTDIPHCLFIMIAAVGLINVAE